MSHLLLLSELIVIFWFVWLHWQMILCKCIMTTLADPRLFTLILNLYLTLQTLTKHVIYEENERILIKEIQESLFCTFCIFSIHTMIIKKVAWLFLWHKLPTIKHSTLWYSVNEGVFILIQVFVVSLYFGSCLIS